MWHKSNCSLLEMIYFPSWPRFYKQTILRLRITLQLLQEIGFACQIILEHSLKKSKCLRPKEYEPTKDKIWSCPFQSQVNLKIVCKENFKYEVQERSPANQVHILVPSLQNPGIGVDCYIFLTKKHVHILNWHCSHQIYSTSETSNGFLWRI